MEMRWIATVDIYTGEEAGDWLRLFHSSAACSPSWREEEKEAGSPHAGATSVPPREGSVLGDSSPATAANKVVVEPLANFSVGAGGEVC